MKAPAWQEDWAEVIEMVDFETEMLHTKVGGSMGNFVGKRPNDI